MQIFKVSYHPDKGTDIDAVIVAEVEADATRMFCRKFGVSFFDTMIEHLGKADSDLVHPEIVLFSKQGAV